MIRKPSTPSVDVPVTTPRHERDPLEPTGSPTDGLARVMKKIETVLDTWESADAFTAIAQPIIVDRSVEL